MTDERTPLELVALAAWLNVTPEQLPQQYRAHTCIATMAAWRRVVDAMREHIEGEQAAEIERLGRELNRARYGNADFAWEAHQAAMVVAHAEIERLHFLLAEKALGEMVQAGEEDGLLNEKMGGDE